MRREKSRERMRRERDREDEEGGVWWGRMRIHGDLRVLSPTLIPISGRSGPMSVLQCGGVHQGGRRNDAETLKEGNKAERKAPEAVSGGGQFILWGIAISGVARLK